MTRVMPRRLTTLIGGLLCAFLVCMGLTVGVAAPAHAATVSVTENGITFTVDDSSPAEGATVIDYDPTAGHDVTIPSSITIGGVPFPVTIIGDSAFQNALLTSVTIPAGVTTIGNFAFTSNQLTSVTIPAGVTTIGDYAFYNNLLTSVSIPVGVTTIGDYAFSSNQLTSVTIPVGVTTIGDYAFSSNQLTSVGIPVGVTTIGGAAFYNNLLTSVTIPVGVTTIGTSAFYNNLLTSVSISAGVTTIGNYAFTSNQLTSVSIPASVATVGYSAFSSNLLTSVSISEGVTTIGGAAFYNNLLTSVSIPAGVTTIGDDAFYNNLLTSVSIPASVTTIGYSAFGLNDGLVDVRFAGNAPTTFTAASGQGSLGSNPDTKVFYDCNAEGFTTPTWRGYQSSSLCTIAFDSQGGTAVADATVEPGGVLDQPADPTRAGYVFTGWYIGADAATLYDFAAPVTGDFTLFAGWKTALYAVAFDSQGGTAVADATVEPGGVLDQPADPTRAGYVFTGWYIGADAATLYDFAAPVTGEFTLFAGWKADDAPSPSPVDPDGKGDTSGDGSGKTPDTPADSKPSPGAASTDTVKGATLARTGAPAGGVLAGAGVLVALGGLALLVRRRRTA